MHNNVIMHSGSAYIHWKIKTFYFLGLNQAFICYKDSWSNRFLIYVILGHFLIFWKLVDLLEIHKWPHFSEVILSLKNQNSKTVIVSHYSFLPWKIYMCIYVQTKGIVRNDNTFWVLIFWKILFHNFICNKKIWYKACI